MCHFCIFAAYLYTGCIVAFDEHFNTFWLSPYRTNDVKNMVAIRLERLICFVLNVFKVFVECKYASRVVGTKITIPKYHSNLLLFIFRISRRCHWITKHDRLKKDCTNNKTNTEIADFSHINNKYFGYIYDK